MELVQLDKLFLPENLQKSVDKANEILESANGESLEEKLGFLAKAGENIVILSIEDRENYEKAKRFSLDLGKLRIAITKVGKSWRDTLTSESRKEMEVEKRLLALFVKTEESLKEKMAEIDHQKIIEERKTLLPIRIGMLNSIEVPVDESLILQMDEKQFSEFFENKNKEIKEEKETKRLKEISEKHKTRYSVLIDDNLFQFLEDKYQQFGELSDAAFSEIIQNCRSRQQEEAKKQAEAQKKAVDDAVVQAVKLHAEQLEKQKTEVEIEKPNRTILQNRTIHAIFSEIANTMAEHGLDNVLTIKARPTAENIKTFFKENYLGGKSTADTTTVELAKALSLLLDSFNEFFITKGIQTVHIDNNELKALLKN